VRDATRRTPRKIKECASFGQKKPSLFTKRPDRFSARVGGGQRASTAPGSARKARGGPFSTKNAKEIQGGVTRLQSSGRKNAEEVLLNRDEESKAIFRKRRQGHAVPHIKNAEGDFLGSLKESSQHVYETRKNSGE